MILDKLKDTFGYESLDSKRTANNKKVIDQLAIEDDMNKFIREDALRTHQTNRFVNIAFKQIRQKNAEINTTLELFLDAWGFQHGGITKENYKSALSAAVRWGLHIYRKANARREAEEMQEMEGFDGDAGDEMKDFPL